MVLLSLLAAWNIQHPKRQNMFDFAHIIPKMNIPLEPF